MRQALEDESGKDGVPDSYVAAKDGLKTGEEERDEEERKRRGTVRSFQVSLSYHSR